MKGQIADQILPVTMICSWFKMLESFFFFIYIFFFLGCKNWPIRMVLISSPVSDAILNSVFPSSCLPQRVSPSTRQAASFTTPPSITSTTRLRWRSSRGTWSATSPGRSASRPSWGYGALKVTAAVNAAGRVIHLWTQMCTGDYNLIAGSLSVRFIHPHVPRELLCALHRPAVSG